ncbi:MAG: GGDEF domain-containing protein [Fibrobacter sp.]|nr:GGDEF domain-containing protein [Fibrobacter sp.]
MNYDEKETLPISRNEFAELEIFKNIQFEKLAGFLLPCKTKEVEQGTTLISPDNPNIDLVIVLRGSLEVKLESEGGTFTSTIEQGHCAGEMSIFDSIPPSATVSAKENSKVLLIPSDIARAMISASHELSLNFLLILSQRIRNNNKIVCEEQYHIRRMEEYAKVDAMTGLHNRRWLEEMYTREMTRSNKGNIMLTAFMLDIDHFKNVNDTYGHLAGDQVLISVAQTLTRSLRPSDMPVRYGGEEFTVFLPGTSTKNAKIIAERIRRDMENMSISLPDGNIIQVTVSIGFAERVDNDTVASLIDRADKALYHAKQNGRNRVCQNLGDGKMQLLKTGT